MDIVLSTPEGRIQNNVASTGDDLARRLTSLPGIKVERIDPDSGFTEAFDIQFPQPLDHDQLTGKSFHQRILLSHADVTRPLGCSRCGHHWEGRCPDDDAEGWESLYVYQVVS